MLRQHDQEIAIGRSQQFSTFSPGNPLHANPIEDRCALAFIRERAFVLQDHGEKRFWKLPFTIR